MSIKQLTLEIFFCSVLLILYIVIFDHKTSVHSSDFKTDRKQRPKQNCRFLPRVSSFSVNMFNQETAFDSSKSSGLVYPLVNLKCNLKDHQDQNYTAFVSAD